MIGSLLSGGSGGGSWWIILVMVGVLVLLYVFSFIKRKKFNRETVAMLDSLKPGDKIKTYSGIYGTVVSIRETTDGKVVTIETGDDNHKSYTSIDANAIYCLDKKEDIVYDKDGNVVEKDAPESTETTDTDESDDDASSYDDEFDVSEIEEKDKKKAPKKKRS